jgi:hypothetical protein
MTKTYAVWSLSYYGDETSPMAKKANEVIEWCFGEVPKLSAEVGV